MMMEQSPQPLPDANAAAPTLHAGGAGELSTPRDFAAHGLSVRQRLQVMFTSYLPLLHGVAVVLAGWLTPGGVPMRAGAVLAMLYVAPALLARVLLKCAPIRSTRLTMGSREFMTWWIVLNLQLLFARLPWLEELLRIVPALYSAWLRLWGARVGRLVFWAPGVVVLDRSFIDVGDDVLFGAGVQLLPHLMVRGAAGENAVLLARVHVGRNCVIGGHTLLGPGSRVAAGETTPGRLLLHPFTHWRGGKRTRA